MLAWGNNKDCDATSVCVYRCGREETKACYETDQSINSKQLWAQIHLAFERQTR